MAKVILAVYDPCQAYTERFLNYVNSKSDKAFEVMGFTDLVILQEQLQSSRRDNRITAVLFSQEEDFNKSDKTFFDSVKSSGVSLIFLGEQKAAASIGMESGKIESLQWINKYQSMENILQEIQECLGVRDLSLPSYGRQQNFELIGIFSPVEKCSHPEAAIAILQNLRKSQDYDQRMEKVLYLNLEAFSGMKKRLDYPKDTCLSDVIYFFKTDPEKMAESLNTIKGRYCGMDVLTAPQDMDDLKELENGGWMDFLQTLAKRGNYDRIVMDLAVFLKEVIDLILENGNLYIPLSDDPGEESYIGILNQKSRNRRSEREIAALKMQEFRQYFLDRGREQDLKKILEVRLDSD